MAYSNLIDAFAWGSTSEGREYWSQVHYVLKGERRSVDVEPLGTTKKEAIFTPNGRKYTQEAMEECRRRGMSDAADRLAAKLGDQVICGTGDRRLLLLCDNSK